MRRGQCTQDWKEGAGGELRAAGLPRFPAGLHFLLRNQESPWLLSESRIHRSQRSKCSHAQVLTAHESTGPPAPASPPQPCPQPLTAGPQVQSAARSLAVVSQWEPKNVFFRRTTQPETFSHIMIFLYIYIEHRIPDIFFKEIHLHFRVF